MRFFIKQVWGIVLLPGCYVVSRSLFGLCGGVGDIDGGQWWFCGGVAGYALLHLTGVRLRLAYVFGHECTHALIARLYGASIRSFQASAHGGRVITTKSNTLITLGPYLVPLYALLLSGFFGVAVLLWPAALRLSRIYLLLLGCGISFHLLMTVDALSIDQPDIREQGWLFSLPLIYITNIFVLCALVLSIFHPISVLDFLRMLLLFSRQAVDWIGAVANAALRLMAGAA